MSTAGGDYDRDGHNDLYLAGMRATITVTDASGTQPPRLQTVRRGESYISQSSHWLHFGLGAWTPQHRMDLTVRWPDGKTATFKNLQPRTRYRITCGGQPEKVAPPAPAKVLAEAKDEPVVPTCSTASNSSAPRSSGSSAPRPCPPRFSLMPKAATPASCSARCASTR